MSKTKVKSKPGGSTPVSSDSAASYKELFFKYQLDISGALLSIILCGGYLKIPFFERFLYIEGKLPNGNYLKHPHDVYFVIFWFLVVTFVRTFLMDYVFVPFLQYRGVKSKVILSKFKEQSVLFTYYLISFSFGLYLLYHSPYWMNVAQLWVNYPHIEFMPGIKKYYLIQMSYWLQQMYFIQIEVRRKDYLNMLTHHVITNSLILISYYCNYTRMGHVFLTLMDFSDIFLSLAKVLNYLKFNVLCDIFFGLFFLSWIPSRHIGFMMVVWSIYVHPLIYNEKPIWDPANEFYFTETIRYLFLVLLLILQGLMIIWFYMILKVLLRIIKGNNAADVRSSDEEDEEDEPPAPTKKTQ